MGKKGMLMQKIFDTVDDFAADVSLQGKILEFMKLPLVIWRILIVEFPINAAQ